MGFPQRRIVAFDRLTGEFVMAMGGGHLEEVEGQIGLMPMLADVTNKGGKELTIITRRIIFQD